MLLMPVLTIDDLSDAVLGALRQRAVRHGRSLEAEVRAILEAAVRTESPSNLGSLLTAIGREAQITDAEVALLSQRDRSLPRKVDLE